MLKFGSELRFEREPMDRTPWSRSAFNLKVEPNAKFGFGFTNNPKFPECLPYLESVWPNWTRTPRTERPVQFVFDQSCELNARFGLVFGGNGP